MHSIARPLDREQERRVHTRLREVFSTAIALIDPFFDQKKVWSGVSLEHFAHRVVREHYPELDATDIYVFVAAGAARLRELRRKPQNASVLKPR